MNKRIYYILIPVVAIIFSIICNAGNAISFPKAASGLSITKATTVHAGDLKKHEKKVNINAIRIKARHDIVAVNIQAHWELLACNLYNTKAYNSSYHIYELYAHLPGYNLRGPPSMV